MLFLVKLINNWCVVNWYVVSLVFINMKSFICVLANIYYKKLVRLFLVSVL